MKAAILQQIGDTVLELRDDVTFAPLGADDVRVELKAAGICHSDISAMNGTLPSITPGIVGHEGAGVVVEVGSSVRDPAVGDHVIICFVPPCGWCNSCLRGEPNLCPVLAMDAFGNPRARLGETPVYGYAGTGTFAEQVVVRSEAAIKVEDDVPFEVGALIACGVMTGVGAVLNTAKVEPGSTVVVIGCGGVGFSVIQGARIAGATMIVAVDPVLGKHELAKKFGATHAVTPEGLEELASELTQGEGFDYAFEVVGRAATIRTAYDSVRRGGTVVVVGAGRQEEVVEFNAFELFVTERKLLGSFYGSANVRRDFARMVAFWRAGLLDIEGMISRRIPLADINEGLKDLLDGNMIRQVVTFD